MRRSVGLLAGLAVLAGAQTPGQPPAQPPAPKLTPEQQLEHDNYLKEYAKWQETVVAKQKEFQEYVEKENLAVAQELKEHTQSKQSDLFFDEGHGIHITTDKTFDKYMFENHKVLVFFYAPWCHHSQGAKDAYLEAAKTLRGENFGVLAAHDCQRDPLVCHNLQITGLPSFRYFKNSRGVKDYVGPRTVEGFLSFMEFPDAPPPPPPPAPLPGPFWEGPHKVALLGEGKRDDGVADFDEFVHAHDKVFVMFHAPWCPHSKEAKPAFIEVAGHVASLPNEEMGVLAAVDCQAYEELCGKFHVKGLPTFKFFKTNEDGKTKDVIEYISLRTKNAFMAFLKKPVALIPHPPAPPSFWANLVAGGAKKEEL